MDIPPEFLMVINDAAEMILGKTEGIRKIIAHYDADGLSAAAIMGHALCRAGERPHIQIVRQLKREVIDALETDNSEILIFLDVGSGQLEALSRLTQKKLIVCDHHPPVGTAADRITHVCPHLYGINGSTEISGSGVTYLVAREMNQSNAKMADVALVGALGDRQDRGVKNSVVGLNRTILDWGIQEKVIEESLDLRFFGRETRPLHVALEYTTDPFIPGLTGNRDKCLKFLAEAGIELKEEENWRTLSDLTQEEQKILVTNLVVHMVEHGLDTTQAEQIVGTVYTLPKERANTPLHDAREFAALLNSSGKMRCPGLGVAVAMSDRSENLRLAVDVANEYRRKLATAIGYLLENPQRIREDKQSFRYFRENQVIDHLIVGTITSIALISRIVPIEKPLVGLAETGEGMIKISARGTRELVENGLDLGVVLRNVLVDGSITGEAGGHDIAAGALIPQRTEEIFLNLLESTLLLQIGNAEDTTKDA
ncbi:MAG: DHH family phosphoesterase [Candidatus Heimdallarchaeota archaeon]